MERIFTYGKKWQTHRLCFDLEERMFVSEWRNFRCKNLVFQVEQTKLKLRFSADRTALSSLPRASLVIGSYSTKSVASVELLEP